MKKRTSFLTAFITFSALSCILISGCKLKIEDTELLDKPGVNISDAQITIIIPKISKETQYINVYRNDLTDHKTVNIGILYPAALENDGKNFIYIDNNVKENNEYQYKARYKDNKGYHYTEWSNKIKADQGFGNASTIKMTYVPESGAKLEYDSDAYTLTIGGTIAAPDFAGFNTTDYKPMLVVKRTDGLAQVFGISSVANTTVISLKNILPGEFLDTDISFGGIVAQKEIKEGTTTKQIIWTEIAAIDVKNGSETITTVRIPTYIGSSGLDISN